MTFRSKVRKIFKSLRNFIPAPSRAQVFIGGVPWKYAPKVESDLGADQETYERIYKYEPFVRGPIGALVDTCIKAGWDFIPRFHDTKVTKGIKGKIKTIKHFFYHPEVQFPIFLRNFITNLLVHDDVYIEIAKGANGAKNIFVLDSKECRLDRDEHGTIEGMVFREGQGKSETKYKPEEFVFVTMNRLGSAFYGVSDIECLVKPANVYRQAINYNEKTFENAGIPTLAYLVKDASEEQFKKIKKDLSEVKVGDNLVLMGDITIDPISLSSKDLEYAELLNTSRREMMSVLRVPSVVIGYESKVSLEGARVQLNTFGFRVNGIQQVVENAVDRVILRLFGDGYVDVRFELNEWLDPYVQAQIDAIHLKWGVVVPNEVRKRLGMKPRKGGNVPYTPVTSVPGRRGETSEDGMGPDTNLTEQQAERQDRDQETSGK